MLNLTEDEDHIMQWEISVFAGASTLILAGCLMPNKWLPSLPNDKLLHFLAFAGLTLLAARIASGPAFGLWLAALLAAGWLVECLQNWVPGRRFCWRDLGANAAGIAVAALGMHLAGGLA